MTTQPMNFGLYFTTTRYRGEKKYITHFLLVCSFVLSPVQTHTKPSSQILCLWFLIPFFTLRSSCSLCFLHGMANPTSHCLFPPKTISPWSPPSLSWSFPWAAEWRLALESILIRYVPISECFLATVLNAPVAVNGLHRYITGSRLVDLGNPTYVMEATV